MTNTNDNGDTSATLLSEEYVQNCFHSYLKSALTHAKAERLLDTDVLSSAEGDLMITGPALCLYFAALRSTTDPPSVPLPRLSKAHSSRPPTDLSLANCPLAFRPFLIIWSQAVPQIQALVPEHQHDLARVICGHPPLSQPLNRRINGIAADLRAIAIEISMRRTFQDRYASDLQAAIDAGGGANIKVKASFVPPPVYEGASNGNSSNGAAPSAAVRNGAIPHRGSVNGAASTSSTSVKQPNTAVRNGATSYQDSVNGAASTSSTSVIPPSRSPSHAVRGAASTSSFESYRSVIPPSNGPSKSMKGAVSNSSFESYTSVIPPSRSPPHSPSILTPSSPAIELIRETLYAALADVLERKPDLRRFLRTDPPRAYFSSVALAILNVATSYTTVTADGEPGIQGVLDQTLTLKQCPPELRPFMKELYDIGVQARAMEEEDSEASVEAMQHGDNLPKPRIERAREILEGGVGHAYNDHARRSLERERQSDTGHRPVDPRRRTTSTENRAVAFANRINALALAMTKLRAFRERQEVVFQVLIGVGN